MGETIDLIIISYYYIIILFIIIKSMGETDGRLTATTE